MNLDQHLAKPIVVDIDGTEYSLGPIGLDEFAEMGAYLRRRPLEDAAKAAETIDDPTVQKMICDEGWKRYMEKTNENVDVGETLSKVNDIEVIKKLLTVAITKNHPNLTRQELSKIVTLDNLQKLTAVLDTGAGFTDNPTKGESQETKPQNN